MGINFGEEKIYNAKIKFSYLGFDETGSLTFQLGFECEGAKVYTTIKCPVDSITIKTILNVLELRSWEELPRKFARIKIHSNKIIGVGNLIEDKWFWFEPKEE